MTPKVARPGEIAFRDRCPADGQRVRVRIKGFRHWWPVVMTWDAANACARDGSRFLVAARLTAWLPAEG